MLAILLALVAATGFSCIGIFVRLGGRRLNPLTGAAISMPPSLMLAIIPALALDMPAFAEVTLVGFLFLALLAVIAYPMARLSTYVAVTRVGAPRTATLSAAAPLYAAVLAVIFLGERPNAAMIAGTLVMVAGIILIVSERHSGESASKNR